MSMKTNILHHVSNFASQVHLSCFQVEDIFMFRFLCQKTRPQYWLKWIFYSVYSLYIRFRSFFSRRSTLIFSVTKVQEGFGWLVSTQSHNLPLFLLKRNWLSFNETWRKVPEFFLILHRNVCFNKLSICLLIFTHSGFMNGLPFNSWVRIWIKLATPHRKLIWLTGSGIYWRTVLLRINCWPTLQKVNYKSIFCSRTGF